MLDIALQSIQTCPMRYPPRSGEVDVQPVIKALSSVELGTGITVDLGSTLSNGRTNYSIFHSILCQVTGLSDSGGANPNITDSDGRRYEVRSYLDPERFPNQGKKISVSPSCYSYGNNKDNRIMKTLIELGQWSAAFKMLHEDGYRHNDYYVFINTAQFDVSLPLRYKIIPTVKMFECLDAKDPRRVLREHILSI